MAHQFSFEMTQGEIRNGSHQTLHSWGDPYDLTDVEVHLRYVGHGIEINRSTADNTITIVDAESGEISIDFDEDVTSIPAGQYRGEIKLVRPTGVTKKMHGQIRILSSVYCDGDGECE